jgi:nicotinamide mononucleotide transporter|tara:strand:+ start:2139 stop:2726 length:588 start_codon:yes stop_codon:yes gene_type:complete
MTFNLINPILMEITAVVFAIIYLLLAVKQDVRCWYAAIFSSFLYFFIMMSANLYMEAYLQIFYIFMAIYGWFQWNKISEDKSKFIVRTWSIKQHLIVISSVISLAYISGSLLNIYTEAALPFIDALTTWGAIIATYMVAKKLLENWIYWFVIDSISVLLFMSRGLYLTSVLFFVYLIIIYFGYKSWTKIKHEMND